MAPVRPGSSAWQRTAIGVTAPQHPRYSPQPALRSRTLSAQCGNRASRSGGAGCGRGGGRGGGCDGSARAGGATCHVHWAPSPLLTPNSASPRPPMTPLPIVRGPQSLQRSSSRSGTAAGGASPRPPATSHSIVRGSSPPRSSSRCSSRTERAAERTRESIGLMDGERRMTPECGSHSSDHSQVACSHTASVCSTTSQSVSPAFMQATMAVIHPGMVSPLDGMDLTSLEASSACDWATARCHAQLKEFRPRTADRKKKPAKLPPALAAMHPGWRPEPEAVAREMQQSGTSVEMAAASLLVGRRASLGLHNAFDSGSCEAAKALASGALKLGAWLDVARQGCGASLALGAEVYDDDQRALKPSRVLTAVTLFSGTEHISSVDASGLDVEAPPDALRLLPAINVVSLAGNVLLSNVDALRACGKLRSVVLTGCSRLEDIRPLGVLPFLEKLDLSGCVSIQDIRSLLFSDFAVVGDQGKFGRYCGARPETQRPRAASCSSVSTSTPSQGPPAPSPCPSLRPPPPRVDTQLLQGRLVGKLGHPALRWLSLEGCTALCEGIEDLKCCPVLEYIDLTGCHCANVEDCQEASKAPSLRTIYWPTAEARAEAEATVAYTQVQTSDPLKAHLAEVRAESQLRRRLAPVTATRRATIVAVCWQRMVEQASP
eukprot:NODE_2675_length_2168_cov_4.776580.p1 GENE.NODE_2675_length_2168_cov_4.776580~~NODE_2675_length_2168_cov_4.776580.p1  ORF type:complete len:661 (+),score=103.02 NODE_2675_length_2168_cov_4.776580:97-2079(+)